MFEGRDVGGVAILNADDRWFDLLNDEALRAGAQVRTFGRAEGCDARLIKVKNRNHSAVMWHAIEPEDPVARAMLEFIRRHGSE